jgi:hypothetical protein
MPDVPVAKSERFAEDFDRSWPPRRPIPPAAIPAAGLPNRPDDKVLFNASLNKLETRTQIIKPPPLPQPTRVMTRPGPPPAGARSLNRLASTSMQDQATENAAGGSGRMLPPHMAGRVRPLETGADESKSATPIAPASGARQAWGSHREIDRPVPPNLSERKELPPQSSAFATATSPIPPTTNLPLQHPIPQISRMLPNAPPPSIPSQASAPLNINNDSQSQEMHTAAEKARLRRLAEEAEREAAAERARRKAKELEERLGLKEPKATTSSPPVLVTQPSYTLAQRPKAASVEQSTPVIAPALAGLPPRPPPESRVESTWRGKVTSEPDALLPATEFRSTRPTAESYFESSQIQVRVPVDTMPAQPAADEEKVARKETTFEDTMKRIQAALKASKISPPAEKEKTPAVELDTPPAKVVPTAVRLPPAPLAPIAQLPSIPIHTPEYFDVTQVDPPKSPPPAWRTYTVKLPKTFNQRLSALSLQQAIPAAPPNSFLMTFNPPISGLSTTTLSRAELLLQSSSNRRFAKTTNEIWVSISPRQFEPYKRQKRKSNTDYPKLYDIATPPAQLEILLPSPGLPASAQLRSQRADVGRDDRWSVTSPSKTTAPHMSSVSFPQAVVEPLRKLRSPVKSSQAVKAEKDGRSFLDGSVGLPERGRGIDTKPGVRFMVNSELEGDSLLDEVNKMSLESVGEGYGEEDTKATEGENKTPGSEVRLTRSIIANYRRPHGHPRRSAGPALAVIPLLLSATPRPGPKVQHGALVSTIISNRSGINQKLWRPPCQYLKPLQYFPPLIPGYRCTPHSIPPRPSIQRHPLRSTITRILNRSHPLLQPHRLASFRQIVHLLLSLGNTATILRLS